MRTTTDMHESIRLCAGRKKSFARLGSMIAWAALALILIGCVDQGHMAPAEDRPAATLRAEDYFPAEPGMTWEYEGWGNEFARYSRKATHRRGERAQIVHQSGAIVAYVYDIHPDRVVLRAMRPEIDDGEADVLDVQGDLSWIILQEPLQEGAEWRTPTGTWANRGDPPDDGAGAGEGNHERFAWETRRIEGVGQSVTTPAGTFRNVIRVRVIPDQGAESLWDFAPGVGLIRSEHFYEESIISELESFHIGGRR